MRWAKISWMLAILGLLGVQYPVLAGESIGSKQSVIPAKLVKTDNAWTILRNGEPYFIKGAGGSRYLQKLAQSGANSVRTWSTDDAQRILDEAHQYGLTVMLGLRMGKERHGFDYSDKEAVAAQKAQIREQVLKYKDHPALLVWGIGNELDLFYTNTNVWYAVEEIAAMIKTLDPHHLVTTVTAGINKEKAALITERVPSIDYLSINIYGGLENLPADLLEIGYQGPYVVTEWGPTGHWEIAKTDWGAPIEQSSTEKAAIYRKRYEQGILAAPKRALGSYAFLWGQKQETTPTWYGVFTEAGKPTEVVDTLSYLWRGQWPTQRAPSISAYTLGGKSATQSLRVKPGQLVSVELSYTTGDKEEVAIQWEILPESTDIKAGGDPERRPKARDIEFVSGHQPGHMQFKVPVQPGPYRLFVYVENAAGKVANANFPFFVEQAME
ncbi:glycoside hydrolase family 2 TIM barrel-domain containing protein [Aliiglaciecola sp. CAU 1673]|uniref:glycoside hydrolase family 2 TIM barrel-domain containing protein n=1 Tax=Aliiglaciecola sp. CAU 1673 TaxID=3032595 RepID=UPI0023DB2C98|nr:glycoside hydrolase family 2 TIM barrel-domain containing protein [Aliiglaciecola sp. CAU 1673]MDF2176886.1 glycoside hydrolase family 2 TIM barrel-domain containing protein [Aliiglaciecola sp. CAU 1673]